MVFALNLMDVLERKGFEINTELLAEELGAPVIPTVAVKGQGITETNQSLYKDLGGQRPGHYATGLRHLCRFPG